ncbi:DNA adenine methylase [Undibacterium amnicola]|uniref:DNA adenine methylase n=1 Tax=Undibacterium amnicola TaxID=1834038 RepID=A0ABR6XSF6_9BURK|nr:DNA adenine methylase [Undibacterium amnicola]MBC3832414.1 DNA adenine methylase [Undibacterium amnicola]
MLTYLVQMDEAERKLCNILNDWGVLSIIGVDQAAFVSTEQFQRIRKIAGDGLIERDKVNNLLHLFPSEHELMLSPSTGLFRKMENGREVPGGTVISQILPKIIEKASGKSVFSAIGEVHLPMKGISVLSKDPQVLFDVEQKTERFFNRALEREKLNILARSASYMGAKTLLCPALCEIVEEYHPRDGVILDLMCGSGATSGAFAQRWQVYASDAQAFSRHLAAIQGGGMDEIGARSIVQRVTTNARSHFDQLTALVGHEMEIEESFLMSEMTGIDCENFVEWATQYLNVNNSSFELNPYLSNELAIRRRHPLTAPATLFTRYYANLFFGVRQAVEIDSLRLAIESLNDENQKKWALGALICAVSACADNYGGHFAQPRFDTAHPEKLATKIKETILRRSMSVTQEFSARLISLSQESQVSSRPIRTIPGPWQNAILEATKILKGQPTLVYLDPPYTRDEYSRYYHVLETLVNYNYPVIGGKAAIPTKGRNGRFASEFFTRNVSSIETTIGRVINTCLENNWSCLWSYSSSGLASVDKVIEQLGSRPKGLEIYTTKYSYKPQGKRNIQVETDNESILTESKDLNTSGNNALSKGRSGKLKPVDEYMIMIRAK